MKTAIALFVTTSTLLAASPGTLIFSDDFNRAESQEIKEEIGNGWYTASETRAKGNKQVDLRDGAMHIYIHEVADHAVSVKQDLEPFKNGTVALRFMLENPEDSLGLNFADLKYKPVHAGHICMVRISTKDIQISDLKTGKMDKVLQTARKAKQLTPEQQKLLKSKEQKVPHQLDTGTWYDLRITILDETMTIAINGKETASFSSEGIGHPTKRTLRLSVPKQAVVDDLTICSLP
ncbi:hypothetical protein P4B35_12500 [Pontiellaceae bacterium B12227]|nr:hypothetical protein [Pontiellaceae bacterium B12227]